MPVAFIIMTDIAKRLADLSPEKRERLLKRLQAQQKNTSAPPISRQPRGDKTSFPLSFAQQRLWFLDRLEAGSPFYNVPGVLEVTGRLDAQLLESCFSEIARRHEILHTRFDMKDGQPVQIIQPPSPLEIPVIDLQDIPAAQRWERALYLAREEARTPFELQQLPLLRITLLKLSQERHLMVFVAHHIVSDAWSRGVMLHELTTLYHAFAAGEPSPLPELQIQYADFAVWQQQWLQEAGLQAQLAYWKAQLGNLPPVLDLPADHPRSDRQTFRGAQYQFTLSPEMTKALQSLSQQQEATLYMTLLAAFQTLLYRYTGEVDVAVGSPIANRNRPEIENLIGFFANTLVLRTDLSGDPSFLKLLERVREVALAAYSNQDVPFEKLVEELQPERNLSHSPLFQVLFSFHDIPVLPELPGLTFELLEMDSGTAKFDLSLLTRLDTQQGTIIATLEYNLDRFEEGTIARLAECFQSLLTDIVAQPEQPISALSLLSPAQRKEILETGNDTTVAYPEQDVCQLFEEQATQTPNAIAVTQAQANLTYDALNRQANQLAHKLQALGVQLDSRVGICLTRSLALPVALLGVLKAGAAYVPLDPSYPEERLAFMIADSEAEVLLSEEQLLATLPQTHATILCLDTDWQAISSESDRNLEFLARLDTLAYVIYTSGSTGKPKGVAMSHRPLSNLIHWQSQHSSLKPGAKTLQFASVSFDVSFQECFATWSAGGTLVLMPEEVRRDPNRWLDLLIKERIERLFLPFVALGQLAEAAERRRIVPEHLQEVITAGEQLQITRPVRSFFQALPNCTLQNQYGPSESHVVTAYTLKGTPQEWQLLPPIGGAIANAEVFILDRQQQPVPIGVPGELCIGGISLARGYLHRPELTAERFIAHPFRAGDRLYKTGDWARYLPDGNIEFLGRADGQVKLRGFRVELGELEAVLGQHPNIKAVVATVREDTPGSLVAYIVPRTNHTENDWRTFVKSRLPNYMVPASFVILDALPLTPSGKVDRRSLPKPESDRPALTTDYVAPRTELERQIASIWQEILQVERVGIHDNFFDLGGHSLLIAQLGDRLQGLLQREIPLATLFQYPTIAAFTESWQQTPQAQPEQRTTQARGRSRREKMQQQRQRRRRE
ncbi:MAG: non-ribosomal peptide synthetase [Cyanobacteria bacterium QH_3_48_40]|nr:MAG: non-ribosomal peptide synthetase [Cyanobacteria bacterium QH_3_48_40]